ASADSATALRLRGRGFVDDLERADRLVEVRPGARGAGSGGDHRDHVRPATVDDIDLLHVALAAVELRLDAGAVALGGDLHVGEPLLLTGGAGLLGGRDRRLIGAWELLAGERELGPLGAGVRGEQARIARLRRHLPADGRRERAHARLLVAIDACTAGGDR